LKKFIKYISYGKYETGGYKHELFFAEQLHQFLNQNEENVSLKIVRKNRFYTNPFAYLKLFLLGLTANAEYNIVVARVALFAVLRNIFTQNKVYIVLHNFDKNDGKSLWLNLYYNALFYVLKNTKNDNISIVTVAPFWVKYFKEKIKNNIPVFYFPNFFDGEFYEKFIQKNSQFELENRKKKQIHLGQRSFKNHPDVFEIAKQLTNQGYYCYFSTNFKDFASKSSTYEVVYFDQFENYLTQMALSEFTLAITGINEGWNRVAHESILVGTPVIAYAKAGLLDLINESKSIAANNVEEVLQAIENKNVQANPSLLAHFDIKNAAEYLNKLFV
jgi:glycosyltransferase involved in cell wall biosynthesis